MWTSERGHRGLFYFFSCCFISLSPFFVIDGWLLSPVLALWAIGLGVRWYLGDSQMMTDSIMFGAFSVYMARISLKNIVLGRSEGSDDSTAGPTIFYFMTPLVLLMLLSQWHINRKSMGSKQLPDGASKWNLPYPKPRIFPCETKHARMFPKRHVFEYSYLQCGFPVIPVGVTVEGIDIGNGDDVQLGSWWLRIRAQDYLNRGNGALGFYGKLKLYLQELNVNDADWSYAYLVTAPRFFGYSFNPVSFWYIYNSDHHLTKMILEVNNTFGERRMYLLDGSNASGTPRPPATEVLGSELPSSGKSRFTDIWMKDFHVSPFNSRKGSYVLKALDPFPHAKYDNPTIDNTITLISSKDHAKLVARLCSTGQALNLEGLGIVDTARFILSWWWVGLVTFPRIVREAAKLYYKRNLHVWFRPEVAHTGVGRAPTLIEIELYKTFRAYLSLLVDQSHAPFRIILQTAIPSEPVCVIATAHIPERNQRPQELEIRILTPAFYSRFTHYAYTTEAFDRECIFTNEKNRTLWVSRPELLPILFNKQCNIEIGLGSGIRRSYLDKLRWNVLKKLRCAPATPAYPAPTTSNTESTTEDVRLLPHSELDQYVLSFSGHEEARRYRKMTTKLFLAQRFCLGFTEIIEVLELITRMLLCYHGASRLAALWADHSQTDISGCFAKIIRDDSSRTCFEDVNAAQEQVWQLICTTVSLSACHLLGLLKGYN
ncbi:hypothetical protein GQ44DRAFT_656590 [Phaeosphaeriaceae sp. PMI808]|nr:hypothetical protein GQ44DRAFT_656590 [Phaeosphaeriaceae sp. PMI808]